MSPAGEVVNDPFLDMKKKALKHVKDGNLKEAEDLLKKLRIEKPDDIDVIISLSSIYLQKDNPDVALAIMELERGRFIQNSTFYKHLSTIYRILNDKERAFEAIRTALSIEPTNPYLKSVLGYTYWVFGETDNAIKETEEALKYISDKNGPSIEEIRIKNNLAYYYAELGKNEENAKNYAKFVFDNRDKAGELRGFCTDTYAFCITRFSKDPNEIREAVGLFNQAVEEGHPPDAVIQNHLKEAFDKLRRLSDQR